MDFEPPSFSLGLESQVPSFSLGLDDLFPATPSLGVDGGDRVDAAFDAAGDCFGGGGEDFPKRSLKRLRRGPSKSFSGERVSSQPNGAADQGGPDDIEEFSDEEQATRSQAQPYNTRSFSSLKPVRTPPVRKVSNPEPPLAFHSRVTSKKTSLGSKEVKFQDIPNTYTTPPPPPPRSTFSADNPHSGPSSGAARSRTPLYEFRDNRICIDLDADDQEPSSSCRSGDADTAQIVRDRFPFFSFVDDLDQARDGEPVYIDYKGQFGRNSSVRGNSAAAASTSQALTQSQQAKTKSTARVNKRKNRSSSTTQVLQENTTAGTGRKGHWVTSGGSKVYVTAEGQRLMGTPAYKAYMKDNGRSFRARKGGGGGKRKARKKTRK